MRMKRRKQDCTELEDSGAGVVCVCALNTQSILKVLCGYYGMCSVQLSRACESGVTGYVPRIRGEVGVHGMGGGGIEAQCVLKGFWG